MTRKTLRNVQPTVADFPAALTWIGVRVRPSVVQSFAAGAGYYVNFGTVESGVASMLNGTNFITIPVGYSGRWSFTISTVTSVNVTSIYMYAYNGTNGRISAIAGGGGGQYYTGTGTDNFLAGDRIYFYFVTATACTNSVAQGSTWMEATYLGASSS